jgi:hypothetical protein
MAIDWADSADKHSIPRDDALYAMTNAEVTVELDGRPGEVTMLYIGHPHGQTDRYLEVIAAHRKPRTIWIFHVMELSDLYRYLLNEGEPK